MKKVTVSTSSDTFSWIVEDSEAWIQEGISKNWWGSPGEFQVEIEDITAQLAQEAINAEALTYLASTDWLIIREVDAGTPCPAEIKADRAAARARIVR